jgi:hypothetical protein
VAIDGGIFGHHPIFHQLLPVMNRRVLLLAGTISALFTGQLATTSAPEAVATGSNFVDIGLLGAGVTIGSDYVIGHEQTPAKPTAQPATQRKVAVKSPPMFSAIGPRFVERPGRRKVKYGRHRWVIV